MQSFFGDPAVNSALRLMDWDGRQIDLFPERQGQDRFIVVGDNELANALAHHSDRTNGFTEIEAALRDLFDHCFDRLEWINSFVEIRLVSINDVRPYLDYWADKVVSAKLGGQNVLRLVPLRRYIRGYGYSGVEKLFVRLTRTKFPDDPEAPASTGIQPRPRE